MTQLLYKTLLVSSLIASTSCSFYDGFKARREGPQIRIVDSQGKAHKVAMHTPQLNVDALAKQGNLTRENIQNAPAPQAPETFANNKYATQTNEPPVSPAERELVRTLEMQSADTPPRKAPEKAEIGIADENMTPEELEYDLGKEETVIAKKASPAKQQSIAKGIYVQAGSFTQRSHAEDRLRLLKKKVDATTKHTIMQAEVNGKTYYRVLFGPYSSKKKAGMTVKSLGKKGYESLIVKTK